MTKREIFMKLVDEIDECLTKDPSGDVNALVDGILDSVNLSYVK